MLDIPTKGQTAIYDGSFFGNSSVADANGVDVYEYDYNLYNASIALDLTAFEMPLVLFADYVKNTDPDELNTGYLAGVRLYIPRTLTGLWLPLSPVRRT